jgi:hypothetical protein
MCAGPDLWPEYGRLKESFVENSVDAAEFFNQCLVNGKDFGNRQVDAFYHRTGRARKERSSLLRCFERQ